MGPSHLFHLLPFTPSTPLRALSMSKGCSAARLRRRGEGRLFCPLDRFGSPSRCWQEFRCSGRFFRPVGPNCNSQGQAKRRPWKTRFLAAQALKERAERRADSVCPYRAENEGWNGFQGRRFACPRLSYPGPSGRTADAWCRKSTFHANIVRDYRNPNGESNCPVESTGRTCCFISP